MVNPGSKLILAVIVQFTFNAILEVDIAFAQRVPSPIAESIARQTTVRLRVSDGGVGTGFFIHPSGIVLTTYSVVTTNDTGELIWSDDTACRFRTILKNKELNYVLLITEEVAATPKLPKTNIRDVATMREGDFLLSRSGINGGPLCTWIGSLARFPDPGITSFHTQMTFSPSSRGAPFLDVDGNFVGYLIGSAERVTFRFPAIDSCSIAMSKTLDAESVRRPFESAFQGYLFEERSLTLREPTHLKGMQVKQVNGIAVESLQDVVLACWVAQERKYEHVDVVVQNKAAEQVIQVELPKQ